MGPDYTEIDETHRLIASNKVEGTAVYNRQGEKLGSDTKQGGYVVDLDRKILEGGPSYKPGQEPRYDRAYDEEVYGYYRLPYSQ